ncbi:type II toxin-antitoxin system VapC family toxin [Methylorubrum extorquens]|uniref:Type II toxin-antitoxin system VapC family toxin n=1 Tax=Methylorubrum extorquens TaxID=408 RepID=A0AAX3WMV4_METEX|nr:type II toxin-antitoxin system VapC family toxin [Methylorubrum extorquens]WHQ72885.1 type II toxin-antitoxin system VapC family toxin [Methylorubrum extorquens]
MDTNVFREIGKTEPHRNVDAWLKGVNDADLAISTLTVREVTKGIGRLRARKPEVAQAIAARVDLAFEAFGDRILPVDRAVAALWGELLADSEKHVDDTGIAATARVHGLVLVTRNTADMIGRGATTLDPFRSPTRLAAARA